MDDALVASMSELCPSGGSDLLFGVQKEELGPESGMQRDWWEQCSNSRESR